jgi:hypothetical protein
MQTAKSQTATDAADRTRSYRKDKTHFSVNLDGEASAKLSALRMSCHVEGHNSDRAFILALVMNRPITTGVDEAASTYLGNLYGLLKLAAKTFAPTIKLNIDYALWRIEKIRAEIRRGSGERKINEVVPDNGKAIRTVSFRLTQEERSALAAASRQAGMTAAAYIRDVIKRREIKSRISTRDVEDIRQIGLLLRAAITTEENRESGEPHEEIERLVRATERLLVRVKVNGEAQP